MRESFLHFIWQFQKFESFNLQTTRGESIQVVTIGNHNTHAGPDFLEAKILLDDITWYGNVEIHTKASDWDRHGHQRDAAYNNVILHVVWEHDRDIHSHSGQEIPTLELKEKIEDALLKKCNHLILSPLQIPCASQLKTVKRIDILSMMERVGVFRLQQKSELILNLLDRNKGSWEETTHQLLFKNFGFKRNSESFLKLAQLIAHKTLIKHARDLFQLEALLFGMAGLLDDRLDDDYHQKLREEFKFLAKKYGLEERCMKSVEWKFLRMRPGNFPTMRIAQLAAFIHHNSKFFNAIVSSVDLGAVRSLFDFGVSDYWKSHYRFGKQSKDQNHKLGSGSIDILLINTVGPILAAYGKHVDDIGFLDRAVALTQGLKPEGNHIIRQWKETGINAENAFDSQALIGLYNDYCLKKKCLSCKIGVAIINQ